MLSFIVGSDPHDLRSPICTGLVDIYGERHAKAYASFTAPLIHDLNGFNNGSVFVSEDVGIPKFYYEFITGDPDRHHYSRPDKVVNISWLLLNIC